MIVYPPPLGSVQTRVEDSDRFGFRFLFRVRFDVGTGTTIPTRWMGFPLSLKESGESPTEGTTNAHTHTYEASCHIFESAAWRGCNSHTEDQENRPRRCLPTHGST